MPGLNTQGQENKRYPAFEDIDKMPWGKHCGELLQDVPAPYLAWCWEDHLKEWSRSDGVHNKNKLANYIWNSRNAINQELGEVKIK